MGREVWNEHGPLTRPPGGVSDNDDGKPRRGVGRPVGTMRWTVEFAASEFGLDRKTLVKRFASASVVAGEDGKFSTAQIVHALFEAENPRDAKDRQHAELLKVQTENAKKERMPLVLFLAMLDALMQSQAATLKAAKNKVLTPAKINEIMEPMRTAKLPLKW